MLYKSVLVFLIIVFLSACSQNNSLNKTRYYQFYDQNNILSISNSVAKPTLMISDIHLPGSLNNRGIAMRLNRYQLQNANWHLWSTSPDQMLLSSAESNLVSMKKNWLILTQRARENQIQSNVRFEVKWHINRFNGGLNNDAEISGMWQLYKHHKNGRISLLQQQYFNEHKLLCEDGYIGLVSALESLWLKVNNDFMLALDKLSTHL
ncbi:hypothetical protein CJF42_01415 [Pseudoalteromonas sp. NBT06-2]|uniref:PqiC family protein n=1 Tax=Pseudoalteromonas sp. NBT06-2 TaxID=2025950 RepID=UPI000BA5B82E|nr:ABC-type transport auxiliary lipoprotein family protein [Pseudoalteromonas sp. NBT06-2]PAJ76164.1 hypothetical protein CJF42_01415 [Pseudoalteromonas sp. NBT06-2]